MTKQYAEMENSREQSRVCARLPLNLQLFAEDTGENGADTNTEGAAGDTGANSDGGNDTPTFDDLLKDKKFQSEFEPGQQGACHGQSQVGRKRQRAGGRSQKTIQYEQRGARAV